MWIPTIVAFITVAVILTVPASTTAESKVASLKQFPYQVALVTQSNWCGGVLISKDWILTSAQCIEGTKTLTAILGAHDISRYEEAQVKLEISMANVYLHENWNKQTLLNDIAAVELPVSVQFTDYIKPVVLPQVSYAELTLDGFDATSSGWSYGKSSELRYGSIDIAKQNDCGVYFRDGRIDDSIICLNTVNDLCYGDLGNPLVLKDASNTLIGLASFGWSSECTLGESALFTRITSFRRWIYETTGVINNRF